MKNSEKTLEMIVNLCKNRGYVYAGSEIYGGLANSWDYGPLGVEFKNNVKKAWLKKFVQESPYNVGLDAAIIMQRLQRLSSSRWSRESLRQRRSSKHSQLRSESLPRLKTRSNNLIKIDE